MPMPVHLRAHALVLEGRSHTTVDPKADPAHPNEGLPSPALVLSQQPPPPPAARYYILSKALWRFSPGNLLV